jgi:hypothetical protein
MGTVDMIFRQVQLNPQSKIRSPQSAKRLSLIHYHWLQRWRLPTGSEKVGVEVVSGTDRCHMLDDPWQDNAIPLRFGNTQKSVQAILEYAENSPINGSGRRRQADNGCSIGM